MLVYAGIFLILLIKAITDRKEAKDNFLFLLLSFILGFNYMMGNDWQHYKGHYEGINGIVYNFDIGYNLYAATVKSILGLSYEMFIGITISICVYILLKNIKKRTENYYLAIIVYLVIYLLGASLEPVIRQMIGITITVFGLKYIEKKEFLKYFILIIIAGQFHSSLYIGIAFYFLDKINISIFKFIILTVIIFFVIDNIDLILSIDNKFTELLKFKKFSAYISLMEHEGRTITRRVAFHFLLMSGYIYIIFNSYKKSPKKENYILNGALIYCLISMFSYKFGVLFRIMEIFSMFFVIAMSSMDKIEFLGGFTLTKRTGKILLILFALFQITRYYRVLLTNKPNNFRYSTYRNYIIERMKPGFYESKEEKEKIYIEKINYLINEERIEKKIILE